MLLKDKRVLLFAPQFFGYEIEIKTALERLGAKVDYFDERPKNDFFTKASIRLDLKFIIRSKINQYFDYIIDKTSNQDYDYILFINPETITEKFVSELRRKQNNAELILYMWDSIKNKTGTVKILNHFDKAFTFDNEDAKVFNDLKFLPLFYIPIYEKIKNYNIDKKYDLCFIGTAHGDRYEIIKEIKKQSKEYGIKFYSFIYLPSRILFYVRKYITKDLKGADKKEFSFLPLSYDEIVKIISESKVVLDIESPYQVGLTMRTIEMLGAEKKIISTNKNLVNYDFYNMQNISILDRKNPRIDLNFIEIKYNEIEIDIYRNYSIESWVKNIINI